MDNFLAIDFETANYSRASVCAVGLARVVGGELVQTGSWIIVPPVDPSDFRLSYVHGITADQARTEGVSWQDSIKAIESWASDGVGAAVPIVAHNAAFDRSVYLAACKAIGVIPQNFEWYCSMRTAKRDLPGLLNHKLNTLSDHFGIALNHHEAGSDARAAALVTQALDLSWAQMWKMK